MYIHLKKESTLHLVLRLRGGVIEPSLAVLGRMERGMLQRGSLGKGYVAKGYVAERSLGEWKGVCCKGVLKGF